MKQQLEYINLKYKPGKNDVVCEYYVDPNRISLEEACENIAAESSIGTWTKVKSKEYVKKLKARVFSIHGNLIKIAYPPELFEPDNVPNILSSIAGNIFGMKAVKAIRLEDVSFPKKILQSFSAALSSAGRLNHLSDDNSSQ